MSKKVIVVGAGINGLVASFYLRRAGFAVNLIERSDRVGGACVAEVATINGRSQAYVGDDNPDLALLRSVGFSVAVANGTADVRDECDYTTSAPGGFGAVREVCDLVRRAHGRP
jgi:YrbI family 3-deoxy-D-manno-octulosonate 8-phosphate phosphatase